MRLWGLLSACVVSVACLGGCNNSVGPGPPGCVERVYAARYWASEVADTVRCGDTTSVSLTVILGNNSCYSYDGIEVTDVPDTVYLRVRTRYYKCPEWPCEYISYSWTGSVNVVPRVAGWYYVAYRGNSASVVTDSVWVIEGAAERGP